MACLLWIKNVHEQLIESAPIDKFESSKTNYDIDVDLEKRL